MSGKKRLFVDMDGTLTVFQTVENDEELYREHFFENSEPNENVVEAVRDIILHHPEIEVYILSSVLADSRYCLSEKKAWLKKYLPEIPEERYIFPPCGCCKKDHVPGGIRNDDFLLDDYSLKLRHWQPHARGIKLLNGINGNNGTWTGDRVSIQSSPEELSEKLCAIITGGAHIYDDRPQDREG